MTVMSNGSSVTGKAGAVNGTSPLVKGKLWHPTAKTEVQARSQGGGGVGGVVRLPLTAGGPHFGHAIERILLG